MAAADVRDMLDLPAEGQPRPHKKQKVVEKRPGKLTLGPLVLVRTYLTHLLTRGYYP